MSNKIETRTDTDRLTFIYSKFRTNLDDLVNLETRLLNDDVPTMDEVRSAIDKVMDEQLTPKGVKNGRCNVTACQKPGANYFNKSTKKYYCAECAREINWIGGRHDTMTLYGTPFLCEKED